ncbi:MAG: ribonuclease P protein component [Flavobacteriaceae bacterium]
MFSKIPNEITRLKSKKAIETLFAEGNHIRKKPLKLVFSVDGSNKLALGFGVSKRLFPRAVDRNRIKRLMREQFKLVRSKEVYIPFSGGGFFIFEGRELPTLESLEKPMEALISQWRSAGEAT